MTKRYNVSYRGLSSTRKDVKDFIRSVEAEARFLNFRDSIAAFQRALIVIEDPETSEISKAYSVIGLALDHDGEVGNIFFEREKDWDPKEARRKLSRGRVLETYVEVDETGNVPVSKPRYEYSRPLWPFSLKVYQIPVEQYLMEKGRIVGIFSLLDSQYDRAYNRTMRIFRELYPLPD